LICLSKGIHYNERKSTSANATLAQSAEQALRKRQVAGSIPAGGFLLYIGAYFFLDHYI
jgi:hypothetical protein